MRNTADQAVKMYFKILKIFRLFGAMLKKEQEKSWPLQAKKVLKQKYI